ncbi:corrinoid protein [Candidatus Aerophobetes bacterium]|nr:corrinoid protein [Candidatus Aerophobetes bacterium]
MASRKKTQELLKGLYNAVVFYDEKAAAELSKVALEESIDAYTAITDGLAAGMKKVGELYAAQEYFVPELLLCSDALYAGLGVLRPHIKVKQAKVKAQIVIGVVEGDIHDIGKNLVKVMFDAAGWIVHDLGKDVKLEKFVEEQQRTNSEIVGLSTLMTTSMLAIPKVIKMIRSQSTNVGIMVGGAPLTRDIAKRYGADGYAENAGTAVQEGVRLVEMLKKRKAQK